MAAPNATGSCGGTPYSSVFRTFPSPSAAKSPIARPTPASDHAERMVLTRIDARVAPSAMRIAILRVYSITTLAITPYIPSSARKRAIPAKAAKT